MLEEGTTGYGVNLEEEVFSVWGYWRPNETEVEGGDDTPIGLGETGLLVTWACLE